MEDMTCMCGPVSGLRVNEDFNLAVYFVVRNKSLQYKTYHVPIIIVYSA